MHAGRRTSSGMPVQHRWSKDWSDSGTCPTPTECSHDIYCGVADGCLEPKAIQKSLLADNHSLSCNSMYGELQCDMGAYRTVRIALYMFTGKRVFLACSDETHANLHCYIRQVLL